MGLVSLQSVPYDCMSGCTLCACAVETAYLRGVEAAHGRVWLRRPLRLLLQHPPHPHLLQTDIISKNVSIGSIRQHATFGILPQGRWQARCTSWTASARCYQQFDVEVLPTWPRTWCSFSLRRRPAGTSAASTCSMRQVPEIAARSLGDDIACSSNAHMCNHFRVPGARSYILEAAAFMDAVPKVLLSHMHA